MPIMDYSEYMSPELGLGRVSAMHGIRTESAPAAGNINWGAGVERSTTNPNQIAQYDGNGAFYGVAIESMFGEYRETDVSQFPGNVNYVANDAVNILRRGRIFVLVLEDVTAGQQAVADKTTGNFRPSGTATTTVSGVIGEFKTTTAANHLAELEINLPQNN